jgi:hypothetical protein
MGFFANVILRDQLGSVPVATINFDLPSICGCCSSIQVIPDMYQMHSIDIIASLREIE